MAWSKELKVASNMRMLKSNGGGKVDSVPHISSPARNHNEFEQKRKVRPLLPRESASAQ